MAADAAIGNVAAEAHRLAGNKFVEEKKWEQALNEYNLSVAEGDGEVDKRVLSNRSLVFIRLHRYPEALADLRNALSVDPSWFRPFERAADLFVETGNAYWAYIFACAAQDVSADKERHTELIASCKADLARFERMHVPPGPSFTLEPAACGKGRMRLVGKWSKPTCTGTRIKIGDDTFACTLAVKSQQVVFGVTCETGIRTSCQTRAVTVDVYQGAKFICDSLLDYASYRPGQLAERKLPLKFFIEHGVERDVPLDFELEIRLYDDDGVVGRGVAERLASGCGMWPAEFLEYDADAAKATERFRALTLLLYHVPGFRQLIFTGASEEQWTDASFRSTILFKLQMEFWNIGKRVGPLGAQEMLQAFVKHFPRPTDPLDIFDCWDMKSPISGFDDGGAQARMLFRGPPNVNGTSALPAVVFSSASRGRPFGDRLRDALATCKRSLSAVLRISLDMSILASSTGPDYTVYPESFEARAVAPGAHCHDAYELVGMLTFTVAHSGVARMRGFFRPLETGGIWHAFIGPYIYKTTYAQIQATTNSAPPRENITDVLYVSRQWLCLRILDEMNGLPVALESSLIENLLAKGITKCCLPCCASAIIATECCRLARYCSMEHRIAHRKSHDSVCVRPAPERRVGAEAAAASREKPERVPAASSPADDSAQADAAAQRRLEQRRKNEEAVAARRKQEEENNARRVPLTAPPPRARTDASDTPVSGEPPATAAKKPKAKKKPTESGTAGEQAPRAAGSRAPTGPPAAAPKGPPAAAPKGPPAAAPKGLVFDPTPEVLAFKEASVVKLVGELKEINDPIWSVKDRIMRAVRAVLTPDDHFIFQLVPLTAFMEMVTDILGGNSADNPVNNHVSLVCQATSEFQYVQEHHKPVPESQRGTLGYFLEYQITILRGAMRGTEQALLRRGVDVCLADPEFLGACLKKDSLQVPDCPTCGRSIFCPHNFPAWMDEMVRTGQIEPMVRRSVGVPPIPALWQIGTQPAPAPAPLPKKPKATAPNASTATPTPKAPTAAEAQQRADDELARKEAEKRRRETEEAERREKEAEEMRRRERAAEDAARELEEEERRQKEADERKRREKELAQARKKEEAERKKREKEEAERQRREEAERQKKAKEEAARKAREEQAERQRLAREAKEQAAAERREALRRAEEEEQRKRDEEEERKQIERALAEAAIREREVAVPPPAGPKAPKRQLAAKRQPAAAAPAPVHTPPATVPSGLPPASPAAASDGPPPRQPCAFFFRAGWCKYGTSCRFRHDRDDQTRPAKTASAARVSAPAPTPAAVQTIAAAPVPALRATPAGPAPTPFPGPSPDLPFGPYLPPHIVPPRGVFPQPVPAPTRRASAQNAGSVAPPQQQTLPYTPAMYTQFTDVASFPPAMGTPAPYVPVLYPVPIQGPVPTVTATARAAPTGAAPSAPPPAPAPASLPPAQDGEAVPHEFNDPITLEIMTDPVFTLDGHSYERASIEEWFRDHSTSPRTGLELEGKTLVPNYALRNSIERYRRERGLP